jgi:hypothetical protein
MPSRNSKKKVRFSDKKSKSSRRGSKRVGMSPKDAVDTVTKRKNRLISCERYNTEEKLLKFWKNIRKQFWKNKDKIHAEMRSASSDTDKDRRYKRLVRAQSDRTKLLNELSFVERRVGSCAYKMNISNPVIDFPYENL